MFITFSTKLDLSFIIYIVEKFEIQIFICFLQVKNLAVAREMVKSMAVEATAFREANGLLIMQKGEGKCLEKIK